MKRIILLLFLLITSNAFVNAQNYTKQQCPYCNGTGRIFTGYYDMYGYPIYNTCPNCGGYGFVLVPVDNVSFQGSRVVELRDYSGGVSYGYGTYYSIENVVVLKDGTKLYVSDSDMKSWKHMIKFKNGKKIYFN